MLKCMRMHTRMHVEMEMEMRLTTGTLPQGRHPYPGRQVSRAGPGQRRRPRLAPLAR